MEYDVRAYDRDGGLNQDYAATFRDEDEATRYCDIAVRNREIFSAVVLAFAPDGALVETYSAVK